jgi:hypothetical protein
MEGEAPGPALALRQFYPVVARSHPGHLTCCCVILNARTVNTFAEGPLMPAQTVQVPHQVRQSLQEASARMDGAPLDELVAAAVHAFNWQTAPYRNEIVRELWFGGLAGPRPRRTGTGGARSWSVLLLTRSAPELVGKAECKAFSGRRNWLPCWRGSPTSCRTFRPGPSVP